MSGIDFSTLIAGLIGLIVGWLIRIAWERHKIELEHKLQIMHEMTSTFHELSNKYYVPLGQACIDLKSVIERGFKDKASFYRFAKLLNTYEKVTIIQLKCDLAESALTNIFAEIRVHIYQIGQMSEDDITRLQEGEFAAKYADFEKEFNDNKWLRDVFKNYQILVEQRRGELLDLLQCCSDVLFMEITCGKEPWYKRDELYKKAKEYYDRLRDLKHIPNRIKEELSNYYLEILRKYS